MNIERTIYLFSKRDLRGSMDAHEEQFNWIDQGAQISKISFKKFFLWN